MGNAATIPEYTITEAKSFPESCAIIESYTDKESKTNKSSRLYTCQVVRALNNAYNAKYVNQPINYETIHQVSIETLKESVRKILSELYVVKDLVNLILSYVINEKPLNYLLLSELNDELNTVSYPRIDLSEVTGGKSEAVYLPSLKPINFDFCLTTDYISTISYNPSGNNGLFVNEDYSAYNMYYRKNMILNKGILPAYRYKLKFHNYPAIIKASFDAHFIAIDNDHIAVYSGVAIEVFNLNNADYLDHNTNTIDSILTLITPQVTYETNDKSKSKTIHLLLHKVNKNTQLIAILTDYLLIYDINTGQLLNYTMFNNYNWIIGNCAINYTNELLFISLDKTSQFQLQVMNLNSFNRNNSNNNISTISIDNSCTNGMLYYDNYYGIRILNKNYYCIYTGYEYFSHKRIYIYNNNSHQLLRTIYTDTPNCNLYTNYRYCNSLYFPNYNSNIHNIINNMNYNNVSNRFMGWKSTDSIHTLLNNVDNIDNKYIIVYPDERHSSLIFINLFTGTIIHTITLISLT